MISNPPEELSYKSKSKIRKKIPFSKWIRKKLKLVNYPFISAYRGFGNEDKIHVKGHVFRSVALPSENRKNNFFKNALAMAKRFMMKPMAHAQVTLLLKDQEYHYQCNENGYYDIEIKNPGLGIGWHKFQVILDTEERDLDEEIGVEEELLIPHKTEFAFISDIDDTFLVSHATKFLKKLYLLLSKNPETRKPFEGVVDHYYRLQQGRNPDLPNPFFYVSSSEWNLYEFIVDFCEFHNLPKGIFLLNDLKRFSDFFKTGGGDHSHKEDKIREILKSFPHLKFVLLGDSGQHDPYIYHNIARDFKDQIRAVYIRDISSSKRDNVNKIKEQLKEDEVELVLFSESASAHEHTENKLFA